MSNNLGINIIYNSVSIEKVDMGVQALQLSHRINSIPTKSPIPGTGSKNLLLYIFQFGVDGKTKRSLSLSAQHMS